jgi:hypothetical protein
MFKAPVTDFIIPSGPATESCTVAELLPLYEKRSIDMLSDAVVDQALQQDRIISRSPDIDGLLQFSRRSGNFDGKRKPLLSTGALLHYVTLVSGVS